MLRRLLFLICFILSNSIAAEVIEHTIIPGKYHKSGQLTLVKGDDNGQTFLARLKYKIKPKRLVPLPRKHRTGTFEQELPSEYATEEGYLTLSRERVRILEKAQLQYMGMKDVDGFQDCHVVKIIPHNNKWSVTVYHHPSIESMGWVRAEVKMNKLPVIGPYTLHSKLKD